MTVVEKLSKNSAFNQKIAQVLQGLRESQRDGDLSYPLEDSIDHCAIVDSFRTIKIHTDAFGDLKLFLDTMRRIMSDVFDLEDYNIVPSWDKSLNIYTFSVKVTINNEGRGDFFYIECEHSINQDNFMNAMVDQLFEGKIEIYPKDESIKS